MRNIVGQTPRGKDFFPREQIIKKIYRRLDAGNHVYISAPRRSGKTAIMRYLEDNPRAGYVFLYISVEDIDDTEKYFELLSEELLESSAVSQLIKASEKAQSLFAHFAEHIKKVKVWNVELETQQREKPKYSRVFEDLMRRMDTDEFRIVLLIDEFPVALERIAKEQGDEAGVEFLHINRSIRQRAQRGLQFIYTGSIGLPNIAGKLKATATINDLNIIEVPPLSREEGKQFTRQLLKTYGVRHSPKTIDYMLDQLRWLMPFFIQLIVQMLIDEYELEPRVISKADVDQVIEKASNHRNNIYFESYYSRLDKSLTHTESTLAKIILSEIAIKDHIPLDHYGDQREAQSVLEVLEFDGYINSQGGSYRFNSPILQLWWRKHAS
ncbi:MAG: ATP-binding protein [Bacteroidota bacterium]